MGSPVEMSGWLASLLAARTRPARHGIRWTDCEPARLGRHSGAWNGLTPSDLKLSHRCEAEQCLEIAGRLNGDAGKDWFSLATRWIELAERVEAALRLN